MVQQLVPVQMRSVAAAICLFLLNIIGMGLGPQAGIPATSLPPNMVSSRCVIRSWCPICEPCAYHYFQAAKTLQRDTQRVADLQGHKPAEQVHGQSVTESMLRTLTVTRPDPGRTQCLAAVPDWRVSDRVAGYRRSHCPVDRLNEFADRPAVFGRGI